MARGVPISGKKFARMRESLGRSQDALAREMGMTKGNIGRIEGLEVTTIHLGTLLSLAEVAGITVDEMRTRLEPGGQMKIERVTAKQPRVAARRVKKSPPQ